MADGAPARGGVAVTTFVVLSSAAAALTPSDSKTFWTSRVFDNSRVGNLGYVSNQSLNGILVRAVGRDDHALWLLLGALVVVFGLGHAIAASRQGRELLGIALVALVGLLVSPVSWIHHLVWAVPVLAVLVGDGTDRRRVAIAAGARRVVHAAAALPRRQHPERLASRVDRRRGTRRRRPGLSRAVGGPREARRRARSQIRADSVQRPNTSAKAPTTSPSVA